MVGVCVVVAVGYSGQYSELLAVGACEASRESLGRCGKHTVIVLIFVGELVGAVAHVCDDAQTKRLRLFRLSMMLPYECHKTFRKANESYSQGSLVYYR